MTERGDSFDQKILALLRNASTREEGVRLLYEVHGGNLLRRLRNKFRWMERERRNDLVSDAVMKLLEQVNRVRPPLAGWLWVVAKNQGIDQWRKSELERELRVILDLEAFESSANAQLEISGANSIHSQFERCFRRLSPQQQAAILADMSGIFSSDKEIALELGTSEANVRQARFKAHSRLKQCMKEHL